MDQGKEFDNALLKNLLKGLDVKIKIGFSHNLQSNPVEKFHRTLWALLKAKKANEENDWEYSLPTLILSYNAIQQYSTNSSPARIFLGRELNIPDLSFLPKLEPMDLRCTLIEDKTCQENGAKRCRSTLQTSQTTNGSSERFGRRVVTV